MFPIRTTTFGLVAFTALCRIYIKYLALTKSKHTTPMADEFLKPLVCFSKFSLVR